MSYNIGCSVSNNIDHESRLVYQEGDSNNIDHEL